MAEFDVHTASTAPGESSQLLQQINTDWGFVPNLTGVLAESPAALKAYLSLSRIFETTTFTAVERNVILLTISRENRCGYCMAAHTAVARMQKVPPGVIRAVRDDEAIPDPKLEGLRHFTAELVRRRGWLDEREIAALLGAGYRRENILEVIVAVAMKTLSNYTNHIAETPLDPAFESAAWKVATVPIAPARNTAEQGKACL